MSGTSPVPLPASIHPAWNIGIIASLWHREILDPMIAAAKKTFIDAGISAENIAVYDAPGSFEIPLIGAALIDRVDALIGLGIVLQGETKHADAIMDSTTRAMMDLQVKHKKPFSFEILHVLNLEQAQARAQGPQNKGYEAAMAVLHALSTLQNIKDAGR